MSGIINALVALWRASGMSFAYDGATFTPGEYVENSGERTVTVELTLDSASITSGNIWVMVGAMMVADFTPPIYSDDSDALQVYDLDSDKALFLARISPNGIYMAVFVVPSADGKCEFSFRLGNDGVEDVDGYAVVMLPSGGVVVSDAITVPVYVE